MGSLPLRFRSAIFDGDPQYPSRRDPFSSEWPAPRPLYRLPELQQRPFSPVVVMEGEKTADAAAPLLSDQVVVSWCNGSRALHTADWKPLAGRQVILWPDADAAGRQAMAALSELPSASWNHTYELCFLLEALAGGEATITALCDVLGVELTEERQHQLAASDVPTLEGLLKEIKRTRQWR